METRAATGIIGDYLRDVADVISRLPVAEIERIVSVIARARQQKRKVLIFGNGGSAATASHFACDLSKGAMRKGSPRIRALALTDSLPTLTAWANDSNYEDVFAEQLECHVEAGDVVIAISGSGNSPNVLKGVAVARQMGAITIGLTAFGGGKLKDAVDVPLVVPVHNMEQAEDVHLVLEHVIATCLRNAETV